METCGSNGEFYFLFLVLYTTNAIQKRLFTQGRLYMYSRFYSVGAFHLGKKPGNFGGSKSEISDW